jgi:hypothetical protein
MTRAADRPSWAGASHDDVDEQAVRMIAQLVLHATSLADRLQVLPAQGAGADDRSSRLERLRQAAESGRLALASIAVEGGTSRPVARPDR